MFLLSFRTQKAGIFCSSYCYAATSVTWGTKWLTVPNLLTYIVFKKSSSYFEVNTDNSHYEHPSD